MPLPKSQHPLFPITIPSTGKKYLFRQFLVKEEKILLTAQQSGDSSEIVRAVEQIITNCSSDKTFDPTKLTTFDFDYVFIRLRAISIDNTVKIKYTDPDDEEQYDIVVNLDQIEVTMPSVSNIVKNDDGVTIVLRYPTTHEMIDLINYIRHNTQEGIAVNYMDALLARCVESIYNDEEVFEFTQEELIEFMEDQSPQTFDGVRLFLDNIPDVTHTATYKNKEGVTKQLVLRGLEDFFTL